MCTTDSMTGTSTSTPTTVASAAPDWNRTGNRGRHRQFEEVAGADQRRRTGDAPLDAQPAVYQ